MPNSKRDIRFEPTAKIEKGEARMNAKTEESRPKRNSSRAFALAALVSFSAAFIPAARAEVAQMCAPYVGEDIELAESFVVPPLECKVQAETTKQTRSRRAALPRGNDWVKGRTLSLVEYGLGRRKGSITLWQYVGSGRPPWGNRYFLETSANGICARNVSLNGGKAAGWLYSYQYRGVNGFREDPYATAMWRFPFYANGPGYGVDYNACAPGQFARNGNLYYYQRASQYQYYYRGQGTHYADLLWCSQIGCNWFYVIG